MSESSPKKGKKKSLVMSIDMTPDGSKNIQINVNQLRTYLAAPAFLNLLAFVQMDDSVNPAIPTPYLGADTGMQQIKPTGSMTVNIEVDDIELVVPSGKTGCGGASSNVIAIRGDVSILYISRPEMELPDSVKRLEGKDFESAKEQCAEWNEVGRLGLTLKEFEIFVCDYNELVHTESFRAVRKRNIVLPLVMSFSRATHQVPDQKRKKLMNSLKNNVDIEQIVIRMSYKDILLLASTGQFQVEQLNQTHQANESAAYNTTAPPQIEDKKEEVVKVEKVNEKLLEETKIVDEDNEEGDKLLPEVGGLDIESQQGEKKVEEKAEEEEEPEREWQADADEFDIKSRGIKLVLINDAGGLLVPVFEFKIVEILANMLKLPDYMNIKGTIIFHCSYFNSLPSKWEPVIEKFGADFELANGDNPKTAFSLVTNQNFNTLTT